MKKTQLLLTLLLTCSLLTTIAQPNYLASTIFTGGNTETSEPGDINQDGNMDIVLANQKLYWLENDGNNNFTPHLVDDTSRNASNAVAADVNGDGEMDIVACMTLDRDVVWYENDGNENFTKHTIEKSLAFAIGLFVIDLDQNGTMDILAGGSLATGLYWYDNDGNENFTKRAVSSTFQSAYSIYAADMNNDGHIDVVSSNASRDEVAWFENDGNENFTQRSLDDLFLKYTIDVHVDDVNGDGWKDIMVVSLQGFDVVWYENNQDGTFDRHNISTNYKSPHSIYTLDYEGDGDKDFVTTSAIGFNVITIWVNDGNENFTRNDIINGFSGRDAYPVDIDNDGDTDIIGGANNRVELLIACSGDDLDGDQVNDECDCDDNDKFNFPGNAEVTDGQDNDCDGLVDGQDPDYIDDVFPVAQCQDVTIYLDAFGDASVAASDVDNGSSDNVGITQMILDKYNFECPDRAGTNVVTLTATDAANNFSACTANVTIEDTIYPVVTCQNVTVTLNSGGFHQLNLFDIFVSGTDNCTQGWSLFASPNKLNCSHLGETDVILTVNTSPWNLRQEATCTVKVTVLDEIDPYALCHDITVNLNANGEASIAASDVDGQYFSGDLFNSFDNCSVVLAIDKTDFDCADLGPNSVTFTATDPAGNAPTCQSTVTVIDPFGAPQLAPQNCGSCSQIRFDLCEGDPATDLKVLLQDNINYAPGASLLWYADNSGSQGNPIAKPVVNMTSKNTQFYWVSQLGNGSDCESEARRMRVRVRKTSTVVLDLPVIGCNTGQIDLAAHVSDSRKIATGYTFYDSDPDVGSPTALGSVPATKGVVNSGQYMLVNLSSSPVTYYATASNSTGCQVTGSDEVISSAGASLDFIPNQTVSAGAPVSIAFSSPNATHILWFNHSSFNNPYIGLLGSVGSGNLTFTSWNATSSPISATIRAIAYNGNCAGEVRDFTITVQPGAQNRGAVNSIQLAASRLNAHDVQIDWQIQYEFPLTHIEIEKQINEETWKLIGTSTHLNSDYIDRSGMGNVTKYRLKLVHADGRIVWSQAVEVNFDYFDSKRFTLYPNPNNGRFSLRAAGPLQGEWRYKLSDQLGRTILIGKLQGSETAYDISHLPAAHYFLLLTSPEGKQYLQRVVKN